MILRSKFATYFMVLLFVFYQPTPRINGQSHNLIPERVESSQLVSNTNLIDKGIDTATKKVVTFSKLVNTTKGNVETASQQSKTLQKQSLDIARQHKIMDSLISLRFEKDSVRKQNSKIKNWKIFHLFNKND